MADSNIQPNNSSRVEEVTYDLIADFAGVFRKVPNNCVLVEENIFGGGIKIKKSGFRLINPLKKRKLVCLADFKLVISFPEALNNIDKWDLTFKPITVKYHIDPIKNKITSFYEQKHALMLIEADMKSLITEIVSVSKYEVLRGLTIADDRYVHQSGRYKSAFPLRYQQQFNNGNSDLYAHIYSQYNSVLDNIYNRYGVVIDEIKFDDVNMPKVIGEAREAQEEQRIKNETNLEKAQIDRKIAQLNAEGQAFIERIPFDLLYENAIKMHLSSDQVVDVLKRYATKANATIIESNGGFDSFIGLLVSRYYSMFPVKGINNNHLTSNPEPIDAEYADANYEDDNNVHSR